jgi:hypothetical protein
MFLTWEWEGLGTLRGTFLRLGGRVAPDLTNRGVNGTEERYTATTRFGDYASRRAHRKPQLANCLELTA